MKEQVIEILNEHYGRLDIIDFEIEYQGALLTDVVLTADEKIQCPVRSFRRNPEPFRRRNRISGGFRNDMTIICRHRASLITMTWWSAVLHCCRIIRTCYAGGQSVFPIFWWMNSRIVMTTSIWS